MRKLVLVIAATAVVVAGIVLVRTAMHRSNRSAVARAGTVAMREGAAERLAGAIRIPTISHEDAAALDAAAFRALHAYLQTAFPAVHAQLQREIVGTHSLLFRWSGSDPSLEPILLAGHLDVVPVEKGTEAKW